MSERLWLNELLTDHISLAESPPHKRANFAMYTSPHLYYTVGIQSFMHNAASRARLMVVNVNTIRRHRVVEIAVVWRFFRPRTRSARLASHAQCESN